MILLMERDAFNGSKQYLSLKAWEFSEAQEGIRSHNPGRAIVNGLWSPLSLWSSLILPLPLTNISSALASPVDSICKNLSHLYPLFRLIWATIISCLDCYISFRLFMATLVHLQPIFQGSKHFLNACWSVIPDLIPGRIFHFILNKLQGHDLLSTCSVPYLSF